MFSLSPMEEKWIYGILTIRGAPKFSPFSRKDWEKKVCFSFVCQDLRDQLLSAR